MKTDVEYANIEVQVGGETKLIVSCDPLDTQRIIDGITRYVREHTILIPANLSDKDYTYAWDRETPVQVNVTKDRNRTGDL